MGRSFEQKKLTGTISEYGKRFNQYQLDEKKTVKKVTEKKKQKKKEMTEKEKEAVPGRLAHGRKAVER